MTSGGVPAGASSPYQANASKSGNPDSFNVGMSGATFERSLEWTRDPASRYLREYPVDAPWDEPDLVEAIVAQVMANFRNA